MAFLRFFADSSETESSVSAKHGRAAHLKTVFTVLTLLLCFVHFMPVYLSAQSTDYMRRGLLRPRLRDALRVLGDRLERPGKERVTVLGSITLDAPAATIPFRFVWELPGLARLDLQVVPTRVLIFDGITLTGALSRRDEDLIENLYYDVADRFFLGQTRGLGTRFLGGRFRLDDGKTPNYQGSYYDIYEVIDPVRLGSQVRSQPRLYYLNSDTLVLERIRYQLNRDSSRTNVEVQIGNWQQAGGQSVPGRVVRVENGVTVFTVTIISAVIGPKQDDGLFAR